MFKIVNMCFFKTETFKHLNISIIQTGLSPNVSVTYRYVTSCSKTQWLRRRRTKHIICNDLWIRNLGRAQWRQFFSIPHGVGWGSPLGLADSRRLHLPVWGLGIGCWLGSLSSPCDLSIGSLIVRYTTLSYPYMAWRLFRESENRNCKIS